MKSGDVIAAGRYAEALFEVVSAGGQDKEVQSELSALSEALKKSSGLEKFFQNPSFTAAEKIKTLEKIFVKDPSPSQRILVRFWGLLLEKNRFGLIHEIAESFAGIARRARHEATAEIRSAVPLTAQEELAIVTQLEKVAGAKVTAKKEVDPRIIGGVVVYFGNKVLDGSIRHRIDSFKKELTKTGTV